MSIPKRINFFWAGDALSWMRYLTLLSCRHYHPEWELHLYTMESFSTRHNWRSEAMQDAEHYRGPNYFHLIDGLDIECHDWSPPRDNLAPAQASDLFQWETLSKYGGYYADMDILFTDRIPHEQCFDLDALFCTWGGYMAIGFCAASPGTAIMRDLAKQAARLFRPDNYQSAGVVAVYGLAGLIGGWRRMRNVGQVATRKLQSLYPTEIVGEWHHSVYPWTATEVSEIHQHERQVPVNHFGIHWFGGHPISQAANNRITRDNWCAYPCTFTNYACEVIMKSEQ